MRLVNSSVMGSCMVGAHNEVSQQLCDGFRMGGAHSKKKRPLKGSGNFVSDSETQSWT